MNTKKNMYLHFVHFVYLMCSCCLCIYFSLILFLLLVAQFVYLSFLILPTVRRKNWKFKSNLNASLFHTNNLIAKILPKDNTWNHYQWIACLKQQSQTLHSKYYLPTPNKKSSVKYYHKNTKRMKEHSNHVSLLY